MFGSIRTLRGRRNHPSFLPQVQNCAAAVVLVELPRVVVLVRMAFPVPVLGEALLPELVVVALSEKKHCVRDCAHSLVPCGAGGTNAIISYEGFRSVMRNPITAARKNYLAWSTAIEGIVHTRSLS